MSVRFAIVHAGAAVSILGLLNFLVLQWFGVRLARVWPLTGWWSKYRWIARRR